MSNFASDEFRRWCFPSRTCLKSRASRGFEEVVAILSEYGELGTVECRDLLAIIYPSSNIFLFKLQGSFPNGFRPSYAPGRPGSAVLTHTEVQKTESGSTST